MPVHCWKTRDDDGNVVWACRWGHHGKVYKSKDKNRARAKAAAQGAAAHASGYRGD